MGKLKNFTLIELLIVIAVIAIIASMLLPALNQARDKAKSITCVNNLKQLGQSTSLYLDDYNEFFPPALTLSSTNNAYYVYWPSLLILNKYTTGSTFVCPKMLFEQAWWNKYANSAVDYSTMFGYPDYGYNQEIGNRSDNGRTGSVRLPEIKKTSATIIFTDVYAANLPDLPYHSLNPMYVGSAIGNGQLDARHLNSVNVTWADGHVTNQRVQTNLPKPYAAGNNPYTTSPFTAGGSRGSAENHFDIQ